MSNIGPSSAARTDERRRRSAAGWSDPDRDGAPTSTSPLHPFEVDHRGRYQELAPVGRGGMGHVVVAHDRRLGRDVALKRIAAPADEPDLVRRLAREARVTAVLEHPSIVPVYDAGVGDDGRMYYTMRLIHGRSLATALRECATSTDRLALLRPFLAVCEAIAFAHSRGVVHRDLKPANIMVGPFGETQVVDWGLAGVVRVPRAAGLVDDALDGPSRQPIGTPGYMSPEQARGEPADPRADVWSLGCILHEIVFGQPRVAAAGVDGPRRRRHAAPRRRRAGIAAPELTTIIEKATDPDPAARYARGSQLADEVARFLDGRRVTAHAYTTGELLRRLARRIRVPLAIGLTATIGFGVLLTLAFHRTTRERNRAIAAERDTQRALDDLEHTTGWALARQAIAELDAGALAEAGVIAAHALRHGESADARGVLAGALAGPRPSLAETIELPGCDRVLPATWSTALCQDDGALALWELEPVRMRWRTPLRYRLAAVATTATGRTRIVAVGEAKELVVLDAERGAVEQRHALTISTGHPEHVRVSLDGDYAAISEGRVVNVISLADRRTTARIRICRDLPPIVAVAAGDARFAVVCGDGQIHVVDAASGAVRPRGAITIAAALRPIAAALAADGQTLAVGGLSGDLVVVDLDTGAEAAPLSLRGGAVAELAFLDGASARLLARTERSGAAIVDLTTRSIVANLPRATSHSMRASPAGVLTGGRRAGRWRFPASLRPHLWVAPAGLASVAATRDGRWIAGARGDGAVTVWSGDSGAVAAELTLTTNAVKAVDFTSDGARLAVSTRHGRGPAMYQTSTWREAHLAGVNRPARRLGFTASDHLIAIHYDATTTTWNPRGDATEQRAAEMFDLAWTPDRRHMAALAVDGGIWRFRGDTLVRTGVAPGAASIATWAGGHQIAAGHDSGVRIYPDGGPARWLPSPTGDVLDLAISHDERFLLAGTSDGTVVVWRLRDDRVAAILRGHRQRVASVVALADDSALSAGWDGVVRRWDLSAIDLPADHAVAAMEHRWGLPLRTALTAARE